MLELTFGVISDHQQTVSTHDLPRGGVHKHQRWDTGYLILVPQLHLKAEKKDKEWLENTSGNRFVSNSISKLEKQHKTV